MPIYKTKTGYKIENVRGESKTYSDAERRLKAVKTNQARRAGARRGK